ncbi:N-acetylmuramoyl-L-alanine amidase [Oceanobacillus massiliensis]|uniref:N-acetylmuramoyl-L-alanine amidase n=1 Tax=Oceanobacillus massiliensis TaxID=1465765 RepID=UPI000288E686|nr:N-acetylmuramoyl-L-alanine amidase [Oceanobacillus massiliensis]
MRNLFVGIGFVLLLSVLFPHSSFAHDGKTYKVSPNVLNVRSEPAADSDIVGSLSKGNSVVAFKEAYGWVQTYYGGKEVWVARHHLIPAETEDTTASANPAAPANQTIKAITVTADSVNLRSGPGKNHPVVGSAKMGDTYNLVDTAGDWHQVELEGDSTGWIAAWLTNDSGNQASPASTQIATTAEETDSTNPSKTLDGLHIVIDPGHGGKDPGAVGLNGVYEKDLVSLTAAEVTSELRNAGATVIETRTSDYFVPLNERAEISNTYDTDAFISLHYNSFPVLTVNGISTYFGDQADYGLAQNIQSSLAASVQLDNREIMQADFRVLRNTTAPSVLIELGFISNPNDLAVIQTADYHKQVAKAITNGLANHFH